MTMVNAHSMNRDGRRIWKEYSAEINSAFPMLYTVIEDTNLEHTGYIWLKGKLQGKTEPLISFDAMQSSALKQTTFLV